MAKLQAKIEVQGAEEIKTLIVLLDKYQDDLPGELVGALHDLADCDACEFGVDEFHNAAGVGAKVETDFHTDKILSVNKILRRVRYCGDKNEILEAYPEHFKLGANGHVFIQW